MTIALIITEAVLRVAAWLVPCVLGALAWVGLRGEA